MKRAQFLQLSNGSLTVASTVSALFANTISPDREDFSISIAVDNAEIAVLSRAATVFIARAGRGATLLDIPRPPTNQQHWERVEPADRPPTSGSIRSGEIVCTEAPDAATAVARVGTSAVFAMSTVCGVPIAYLVRVFPIELRLETYALPATSYAAKAIYVSRGDLVVIMDDDHAVRLGIKLN
jgi:hypothetical protein